MAVSNHSQQPASCFKEAAVPEKWAMALKAAVEQLSATGYGANVIIGSSLYQSLQIDKPDVPREDLPSALPFLVKDLVNDRVADIVADGFPLESSDKLQAYVTQKKNIEQLLDACRHAGIELLQILPEEMAWGKSQVDVSSWMLLHRSSGGDLKLSAYHEQTIGFHRLLRGFSSPLGGEMASSLQLDGLALELQRSFDYLNAQLKTGPINQLYLMCDDESGEQLANDLRLRLSVQVAPLPVPDESIHRCGEVLAWAGLQLFNADINLYPDYLRPKKNYLTLQNLGISWVAGIVLLMGVFGYLTWQSQQLEKELTAARTKVQTLDQELNALNKRLAKHKPLPARIAAVSRLKETIKLQETSLNAISGHDTSLQIGYSGMMQDLAKIGRNDISLTRIYVQGDMMDLQGLARNASVVPNWLQQFQSELHLVGRTFKKMSIGRDEQDRVTFSLLTEAKGQ
ncbi:MSHA biogenesis protein MshI [Vibrio sp. Of7-15]|uniref:MSHA biogenesis protein MshI n=1 Tax=Vibrio sp. Of7-15 TaxID=2724879 RepID=UPI001EF3627E|nr:MSHA biogenesis protein MshI [Vibrio sp. Of7-15]MCG7498521.1 MSHA biogenesis protein MshI [Vibrio sp. Of7-15]